ncbi:MAG: aminopeptidase P family protein [Armatimonadetes bacterium]|nr:aminopeptidase P family protein [Armatimonadota bacterium]
MSAGDPISRLRERMAEKGVEAALITHIVAVRWLTGFTGSSGFVILTPADGVFVSDSRYNEQAREQVTGLPVEIFATPVTAAEAIGAQAKRLALSKLAFEAEHVTFATHASWAEKMDGIELTAVEDLAGPLRMVKSPEEIEKIRHACGIADACFKHVQRLLQPGVTEYDIALDIEFYIRRQGAKVAFDVIAISGPRSARPHGTPSERRLRKGDFVTMDFGAMYDGYCSDLTRTVVIGEASERHREVYNAVLETQNAAIEAMKPGVEAKTVDALARSVLARHGLAKYFGHGLGHGVGRDVHDVGRMNAQSKDVLEPGQVWTVEPGVYIEGFGGCRIEDIVLITESGNEALSHAPKELMVL